MFGDVDDIVIPGFSGVELRAEDFPTKLPEPQPRRPPTPHVTVHQYVSGSQRSLRPSPLDVGRRVAEMATTTSGWRIVNPPAFECMLQRAPTRPLILTVFQLSNLQGRSLFYLRTTCSRSLVRSFPDTRKGVGRIALA